MILATLEEALGKLDANNENHWTKDGLPRLETLKMLTGDQSLTRETVSTAYPDFKLTFESVDEIQSEQEEENGEANEESSDEAGEVTDEEGLLEQLGYERKILALCEQKLNEAKAAFDKQTKVVDDLILAIEVNANPSQDNQTAIMTYLTSQRKVLDERKAKMSMIAESGIDLKLLAFDLRAPIDVPKKRR